MKNETHSILKGQIKKYNKKEKDQENVEEIDILSFNLSVDISVKQKKHLIQQWVNSLSHFSLNSKEKYK